MSLKLREWRKALGVTQRELYLRSGVSVATISHVEEGHEPRPGTVAKLAEALNTTAERLRQEPD